MSNVVKDVLTLKGMKPAQKIATSFLAVIAIGAILLMLPLSNKGLVWQNPLDALFTATSATCVTGLVVAPTLTQYTVFGQFVIIFMIQIGGLGLMTLVATFILMLRSRLSVQNRIAMLEMLNQSNITNFRKFLYGVIKYTAFFEGLGTLLLMIVFVPKYGLLVGLWKSIFISISAFCNAGFDILGTVSLAGYVTNPLVNFVVMILIVCGGLGFAVWFDCREKITNVIYKKTSFRRARRSLALHTKFVLVTTFVLIILPALVILIIEFNNPDTLGNLNFFEKVMASFFESITFRTAGFQTIDNGFIYTSTKFLGMVCMFIGGSPGGTAGGIKTTTLAIVVVCVICRLRGQNHTDVLGRHISRDTIVRATSIILVNVMVLFVGIFLLSLTESFDFDRICFEAASALATVGLTTGITPYLSWFGKIIIILLMYIGRIGIMTLLMSLMGDTEKAHERDRLDLPEGHVIVG